MSISCNVYVGPYLQLNRPTSPIDIRSELEEKFDQRLFQVNSEHFDISVNVLLPNNNTYGINFDSKHGECEIHDFDKLDKNKLMNKFNTEYKDVVEFLKQAYQTCDLKFGLVYYKM